MSPSGIERDSRGYRAAGRAGVVAVRVVCVSAAPAGGIGCTVLAGVILASCPLLERGNQRVIWNRDED